MVTGYKALLAIAETRTKSLEVTIQAMLANKKLKEQRQQKQQEEQAQKQREEETHLRLRYFEKQESGRLEMRRAENRNAQEAILLRREAARWNTLRYGRKSKWPPSLRKAAQRSRPLGNGDEKDVGVLTREEKRMHRAQAQMDQAFQRPRSFSRAAVTSNSTLAALPQTLTRLNTVKRDTRSIDDIVRDRRASKGILGGDLARNFEGWFHTPSRLRRKDVASIVEPPSFEAPTSTVSSTSSASKKRRRTLSVGDSVSPPPKRRRRPKNMTLEVETSLPHAEGSDDTSFGDEIWALFGKRKAIYVARDLVSDSDDDAAMEVGADTVEREELVSDYIANEEERKLQALERARENEKRRRKDAQGWGTV
ncbi:hypothetical protein B0H16DRAFT_1343395 [Mycena metata]|uniref:Uncharacterized protein n=1 Tax=Mycena metata TaxID=1033252 RepID=A0AAD7H4M1_9AGAR|nr:hypothetical protein B0H16DRAFT_1343395 [Mycena metata]